MERLRKYHRRSEPPDPAEESARSFRPDERMERLLRLRTRDRPAFDAIVNAGGRIALAHYEAARAAHERRQNGGTR